MFAYRILYITVVSIILSTYSIAQQTDSLIWHTNFDNAKAIAKETQRPILLVFSGSDWCKPCILLKKEIFETAEFTAFAKDSLVTVLADFPRQKKNTLSSEQIAINEGLAKTYNPTGLFPHVVLLSPELHVIRTFGYQKISPRGYIQVLTNAFYSYDTNK
jgi:thioredoxin-related protein